MKDNDIINVYWAPAVIDKSRNHTEVSMFYKKPTSLLLDLLKYKADFEKNSTMFACPATRNKLKNTFVFRNSLKSHYEYFTNEETGEVMHGPVQNPCIPLQVVRKPNLTFGPILMVESPYIVFADQDVDASFSQPTFHKPGYTNYGTIIPGRFNIGSWFRPYACEIQMWENSGQLIIEEDEPIFYLELLTDKKVNLIRFEYTNKLADMASHCVAAPTLFGFNLPLIERYKRFKSSRMNEIILQEIKKNIINDY